MQLQLGAIVSSVGSPIVYVGIPTISACSPVVANVYIAFSVASNFMYFHFMPRPPLIIFNSHSFSDGSPVSFLVVLNSLLLFFDYHLLVTKHPFTGSMTAL